MDLSESEVQQLLDLLLRKHFLRTLSGFGNRVVKYEQRFCNSEFGQLKLARRTGGDRHLIAAARRANAGGCAPASTGCTSSAMSARLSRCCSSWLRAQTARLWCARREPGKRESRFMHLFSGQIDEAPAVWGRDLSAVISALENEVSELKRLVQHLLARWRMTKLRGRGGIGQYCAEAYLISVPADWTLVGVFAQSAKRSRCATATAWPVSPVWTARRTARDAVFVHQQHRQPFFRDRRAAEPRRARLRR